MSSPNSTDEKLSDGWVLCSSKSSPGRKYYFNRKTGKSSWTQPQESNKTEQKPSYKEMYKTMADRRNKEGQKNLKRKSDEYEQFAPQKKQKQAKVDVHKRHSFANERDLRKVHTATNTDTPTKSSATNKTKLSKTLPCLKSGNIKKPKKNLANARLSQLRTKLNEEIKSEEKTKTSNGNKTNAVNTRIPQSKAKIIEQVKRAKEQRAKASQNKNQKSNSNSTPTKTSKIDKSPTSDSKLNQSPSNESLHSIPSPSQFFAANKIICSMKAQLPEQFSNKSKQKDTFADIEKGICSQTPDYPFSKHPATPPQFSEANKLVSAIKSKLAYKVSTLKDVNTFSSAKQRMEALKSSFSKDVESDCSLSNSKESDFNKSCHVEAMDVEDYREIKQSTPIKPLINIPKQNNVVLIVDTNIFIHELDIIKAVLNSHLKGYSEQPTLLVPWRVINELDRLKDNNNGNGAVCKRAKAAMDYLYKSLPENNRIKGQPLRDANSHIYPCEVPDDEILNCSLQQVERGMNVLLVTNDKNLCNKATINGVQHIGITALRGALQSRPQPAAAELRARFRHCADAIYPLLANILENEMRAKYNNLWRHVLFKAPPWSLDDVLQCLLKHWIAVFNEVFPRIEQLIHDLKTSLVSIQTKDPKTITQSEVISFKELCLDVARRCQIIPEYMEMAKQSVEKVSQECQTENSSKACTNETDVRATTRADVEEAVNMPADVDGNTSTHTDAVYHTDAHVDTQIVVDAFEFLWTVYSSYCAKLASGAGVAHGVDDSLPGDDSLDTLLDKLPVFADNIDAVARAMNGVLSAKEDNVLMEEAVNVLEEKFREALTCIGIESSIQRQPLRVFCDQRRHMIQEAYSKFAQLSDLLVVCKERLSN